MPPGVKTPSIIRPLKPLPRRPRKRPAGSVSADRDERLDHYLVRTGLADSRRGARAMVEEGLVRINGRRCRKGEAVHSGDVVEVAQEPAAQPIEPVGRGSLPAIDLL